MPVVLPTPGHRLVPTGNLSLSISNPWFIEHGCARYQEESISASSLEAHLQGLKDKDGNEITEFYFNKGL